MSTDTLNKRTYRKQAQQAIDKYTDRNLLVDAFVWSQIVGLYEADLKRYRRVLELVTQTYGQEASLAVTEAKAALTEVQP